MKTNLNLRFFPILVLLLAFFVPTGLAWAQHPQLDATFHSEQNNIAPDGVVTATLTITNTNPSVHPALLVETRYPNLTLSWASEGFHDNGDGTYYFGPRSGNEVILMEFAFTGDCESDDPFANVFIDGLDQLQEKWVVTCSPSIEVSPAPLEMVAETGSILTSTFTISNTGLAPLTWEAQPDNWDRLSLYTNEGSIEPGESEQVTVEVNAFGLSHSETFVEVTLNSNDPDRPEVVLVVHVIVLAPDLTYAPHAIVVSGLQNTVVTQTLTIRNEPTAEMPLSYSLQPSHLWMTIKETSGVLEIGEVKIVQVVFNLTYTFVGQISIVSNDPSEGSLFVPVFVTVQEQQFLIFLPTVFNP